MNRSRDRKFPTFLGFVPPTGPIQKVSIADALREAVIESLRDHVRRSGWRMTMQRAAHVVIDKIADVGLRFELICTKLSAALGLSRSMGSYYLKRLREVGFLKHYRKHYMDWERTDALRKLLGRDDIFCAAPAVHELLHNPRSEHLFQTHPESPPSRGSTSEKVVLSWAETHHSPPDRT